MEVTSPETGPCGTSSWSSGDCGVTFNPGSSEIVVYIADATALIGVGSI